MMQQQSPGYSPVVVSPMHHSDASRPSLGFPLGTAMLLIVIFTLSGVFSCCYHWDKFRSLRQSFADAAVTDLESSTPHHHHPHSPSKSHPKHLGNESLKIESVPVMMPGERIPTFMALPSPCAPPRPLRAAPSPPPLPPKPPLLSVPFY